MSVKLERLNNTFVEKISEILHDEVKDKEVKFVTITEVRITNDLSIEYGKKNDDIIERINNEN